MGNIVIEALVIIHIPFEDLGSLGGEIALRGYAVQTVEASTLQFDSVDFLAPQLLVVLGGPIGAYETERYPFLKVEIARLRDRLNRRLPTLGICLGAQLMARALGAPVYPGNRGKEISTELPLIASHL